MVSGLRDSTVVALFLLGCIAWSHAVHCYLELMQFYSVLHMRL